MFIEITRRLSRAPEERHMPYAAPPELGKLLRNVFYKHYAPPALQNLRIRQQCLETAALQRLPPILTSKLYTIAVSLPVPPAVPYPQLLTAVDQTREIIAGIALRP